MKRLDIASAKLAVVFPEGSLPAIDPADPAFVLALGGLEIRGKVNPKAARNRAAATGASFGSRTTSTAAGLCHLVAEQSERPAGHRRPLRCRGVPHFQPSRRSERLHIFPAGVESSRAQHLLSPRFVRDHSGVPRVVEANRPAVELIIKGAEQVDGISGRSASRRPERKTPPDIPLRLESVDDRDNAYGGQSARREGRHRRRLGLLSRRPPHHVHVRRRERLADRASLYLWLPALRKRLATWRRIPVPLTTGSTALEEVVECQPRPECDAFTLKIEYLDLMRFLYLVSFPLPNRSRRSGPIVWVICSCPSTCRAISTR